MHGPVAAAALCLAAAAPSASTQPVELSLSVSPPEPRCPTREGLEAAVVKRLGLDPFQSGAPRSLHVVLRLDSGSWLASLELREDATPLGHQQLRSPSPDCADMEPLLVLAISVVCGSNPTVAPQQKGVVERQYSVVPEAASGAPTPTPTPEASSGPRLWTGAGPVVTAGAAPEVAVGGTVEIEANWRNIGFGLQGRADFPVTKPLTTGQLETNVFYGALLPCGRLEPWSACGLVAFGNERAAGSGYSGASTATSFYAALGVQARFDLALSKDWEIRFHADLLAPLTRAVVEVQQQEVWQVPAVSFGLGAELLGAIP